MWEVGEATSPESLGLHHLNETEDGFVPGFATEQHPDPLAISAHSSYAHHFGNHTTIRILSCDEEQAQKPWFFHFVIQIRPHYIAIAKCNAAGITD